MSKQMIWTGEQNNIFGWFEKPRPVGMSRHAVVPAVAGSGKTTTAQEGLNRAPEQKMGYFVFGARNRDEAVQKITNPRVNVLSLHQLGNSFVRSLWPRAHVPKTGSWWFEVEKIKSICPEFPEQYHFMIIKLVSLLKNHYANPTMENAEDFQDLKGLEINGPDKTWNAKIPEIALDMITRSKVQDKFNRITFDDMVFLPVALNLVKPSYDLVLVDEAQDMNSLQLEIAYKAMNPNGRFCLIGDDHQGMFGFRGALQGAMEIYKTKLNAEVFPLTYSQRCPKAIGSLVTPLVPHFKPAEQNAEGEVIQMTFDNAITQIKVNDVVLSRKNAPLMPVALKLLRKKTPAYILGKDIGKQLVTLVKDLEATDLYNLGNKLQAWYDVKVNLITGKRNASERIDLIKDQKEMLEELSKELLLQGRTGIADMINAINSLFYDNGGVKYPAVTCSSVHKAKGLEWPTVYLLSDTLYVTHPKQTPADKQEEKNIHYVALTRTKNKLVLVDGLGQRQQQTAP